MFITLGAQRVTNTLTFTGCPTITDSNKKTTKRRHLRSLNRIRRNSFITGSNCRTAFKKGGILRAVHSFSHRSIHIWGENMDSFEKIFGKTAQMTVLKNLIEHQNDLTYTSKIAKDSSQ